MKPIIAILLVGLALLAMLTHAADLTPEEMYPASSGPYIGDWVGLWTRGEASFPDIGAQVIPLGKGTYRVKIVPKIYQRTPPFAVVDAAEKGGALVIEDDYYYGEIRNGVFTGGRGTDGKNTFKLERYTLISPTLGAKPPEGAVALYNGSGFDAWLPFDSGKTWTPLPGGVMRANPEAGTITSKRKFRDVRLHVEFRLPLMPEATGQARGNSGVFLQDIFEVQVLDSYGLEGHWNECGAMYKISAPYVNMCAPPLVWQTYDIEFRAGRFDGAGKMVAPPRISVLHNGVYVQKDQELPHGTSYTATKGKTLPKPEPGSIKLQDHKNYVEYRNIWAVPLE